MNYWHFPEWRHSGILAFHIVADQTEVVPWNGYTFRDLTEVMTAEHLQRPEYRRTA